MKNKNSKKNTSRRGSKTRTASGSSAVKKRNTERNAAAEELRNPAAELPAEAELPDAEAEALSDGIPESGGQSDSRELSGGKSSGDTAAEAEGSSRADSGHLYGEEKESEEAPADRQPRPAGKRKVKKQGRSGKGSGVPVGFVSGLEEQTKARSRLEEEEREELRSRQRRINRRALQRERRAREVRRNKILLIFAAVFLAVLLAVGSQVVRKAWATSNLSEDVLAYQDMVEIYAAEEDIEEYVDVLMAIMMVESEGTGEDVMQSSESKGLERNSLDPEESIEQACIYFRALVDMADELGINDDKALIQAYNFGPGYLEFLAENGKKHRQKLAIEYAKEKSGGEKIRYMHLYAIKKNGGWIYKFGNMFYDALVQRYL